MKKFIALLAISVVANAQSTINLGNSVSFAWDGNLSLISYNLYNGDKVVATVRGERATVSGLPIGAHTFVVKGVTAKGIESGPSNSVVVTVVVPPPKNFRKDP